MYAQAAPFVTPPPGIIQRQGGPYPREGGAINNNLRVQGSAAPQVTRNVTPRNTDPKVASHWEGKGEKVFREAPGIDVFGAQRPSLFTVFISTSQRH